MSPYYKDFEAKPTAKKANPDPDRHSGKSGGENPDPDPDLKSSLASSVQYLSSPPDPGSGNLNFPAGKSRSGFLPIGIGIFCTLPKFEIIIYLFIYLFIYLINFPIPIGIPDRDFRPSGFSGSGS